MKSFSNILSISGSGRNVGKTSLGIELIKKFKSLGVYGIKISPHFHDVKTQNLLQNNGKTQILEEHEISTKDSSLFLQAGAEKVYYMQASDKNMDDVIKFISEEIPAEKPVIIESGAIHSVMSPGLSLFVTHKQIHNNSFDDVLTSDSIFSEYIEKISFKNNLWKLNLT